MVSVRESRRKHIRSDDSRLTVEGLLEGTERPRYLDLMQGGLPLQKSKPEIVGVQLNFDSIITDSVEVKMTKKSKVQLDPVRIMWLSAALRRKSHKYFISMIFKKVQVLVRESAKPIIHINS